MSTMPESSDNMPSNDRELSDIGKELVRLKDNTNYANNMIIKARGIRDRSFVFLLFPFISLILLLIPQEGFIGYEFARIVRNGLQIDFSSLSFYLIIFLLLILLFSSPSIYFHTQFRRWQSTLNKTYKEIEEVSLRSPQLRVNYLQKQFASLNARAGRINWIDSRRRQRSEGLRLNIGDILAKLEELQIAKEEGKKIRENPDEVIPGWDDAQFMLTQWEELLNDEERELQGERNWKIMSIGIALLYLVLLLLAIPFFRANDKSYDVFGIPFSIVVWGGLGSFAAILYKFYKSPRRVNFEIEFRWLIARPIIGIIMGALAYLALISSLLIFNATSSGASQQVDFQETGQFAQFWIVAFLAGFSDKFYEKIIEWLTGKFTTGAEQGNSKDTEKTQSENELSNGNTDVKS